MALGANRMQVLRSVLMEGIRLAASGLAIGTVCALLVTQWMRKLLYDVKPTDPATLIVVAVILAVAAAAACYGPASRAARTDPMEALRQD